MCGIEAGRRGRRVRVIDHAAKPAEKIRISGGGRCNFTNLNVSPKQFLSDNPHFCVSALKRFTPSLASSLAGGRPGQARTFKGRSRAEATVLISSGATIAGRKMPLAPAS